MYSLVILLLFCPLIFSAAITIGALSDYNGETQDQHPMKCYKEARRAGVSFSAHDPKPLTSEQLRVKEEVLQTCISEMALTNPKVKKVEKQLVKKMMDTLTFIHTDFITCALKMKSQLMGNECYKSTGMKPGDYYCNDLWGKDGCMIKIYDDNCGQGTANTIRDMALFQSSHQNECIAKYFKKN